MGSEGIRYLSGVSGLLTGICLGLQIFGVPAVLGTAISAYDPAAAVAFEHPGAAPGEPGSTADTRPFARLLTRIPGDGGVAF